MPSARNRQGKMGKGGAMLTPNELVFIFGGLLWVCESVFSPVWINEDVLIKLITIVSPSGPRDTDHVEKVTLSEVQGQPAMAITILWTRKLAPILRKVEPRTAEVF